MSEAAKSYVAVIEPHQDRIILDGQYVSLDQIRMALEKYREGSPGNVLTDWKTNDVMNRGYKKIGHILQNPDTHQISLIAHGAVAWLEKDQYQWIMHGRDHVRFEWPAPISELIEQRRAERACQSI